MMLPEKIQAQLSKLPVGIQQLFQLVIDFFRQSLAKKDARIKELEDQIAKNSSNSSKPPSTDKNKPNPKSLRPKTNKKPGGQKGHKGSTLEMTASPDHIEQHKVTSCTNCQKDLTLQAIDKIIRRQVVDIPPIKMETTEHQVEVKTCTCGCVNTAIFPVNVNRYVQYGPRIKGLIVYLQNYQLLPSERTSQLIEDLFEHRLSTGTLYNTCQQAFNKLGDFEEQLKLVLSAALVAGFDETGFRVHKTRMWLHSCSTELYAYYTVHRKRGYQAMQAAGVLSNFKGTAIHDFWKSYFKYTCKHGLCNAHMLRDLCFITERFDQTWSEQMSKLLCKMKAAKDKAILKGKKAFSKATINRYRKEFDKIIQQGLDANPFEPPKIKKRGRVAKSKPRNLVERLQNYVDEYLLFFTDFNVPFDNNFSERDIRMMKVKQKISGCFRSLDGAKYFARIRSYIVTARKQNVNAFDALCNLFMDNTIPNSLIRTHAE